MNKTLRFAILERDEFRCQYCGWSAKDGARLEVDHIHPVSRGGSDLPANLVTACFDCNRGKRDFVRERPRLLEELTEVARNRYYETHKLARRWIESRLGAYACNGMSSACFDEFVDATPEIREKAFRHAEQRRAERPFSGWPLGPVVSEYCKIMRCNPHLTEAAS